MTDNCGICLEKCDDKKTKCNHAFHGTCLKQWLRRGNTCPICRTELKEKKKGFDGIQSMREYVWNQILSRGRLYVSENEIQQNELESCHELGLVEPWLIEAHDPDDFLDYVDYP